MTDVAASPDGCVYRIDASDTITYVSPQWIRFAEANDAPDLTADAVVGKPIWAFINGADTQSLYKELFRNLRSHPSEIIIPFRCDSPSIVRHMSLTLGSLRAKGIEFEGRILQEEVRKPVALLSKRAARSRESIEICSLCRRLFVHGEWIEVTEAIVRRRLFNYDPVPRLEETVCLECRTRLNARIQ